MFFSPLKELTPTGWAKNILNNFAGFLQDHAACERKASALAMSLVIKYPDRHKLIDPMVSLAREELEHFQQVFRLMQKLGIELLEKDDKNPYVNQLTQIIRHGRDERFLDKLIVSGLIEARGHERFHLLSDHLTNQNLKTFYVKLAEREAGHYRIFLRIAEAYFAKTLVEERLEELAILESQIMTATPWTHRLH